MKEKGFLGEEEPSTQHGEASRREELGRKSIKLLRVVGEEFVVR